ncbi:Protein of unknown function [Gryllus bimaculatus]|nr:Protein of unknown function [Gryllus bimaculatus]
MISILQELSLKRDLAVPQEEIKKKKKNEEKDGEELNGNRLCNIVGTHHPRRPPLRGSRRCVASSPLATWPGAQGRGRTRRQLGPASRRLRAPPFGKQINAAARRGAALPALCPRLAPLAQGLGTEGAYGCSQTPPRRALRQSPEEQLRIMR